MCLHYCVKLKSCFCENSNAGKAKLEKCYLLTFILLIEKNATFWLWYHIMANLITPTWTKLYQNSASFCKRYDKNILVCFRFTVLTAIHLQNVNAKFHKVE